MLESDLLGSWRLMRAFSTRDGEVVDEAPLGPTPTGFINYSPDHHMAVVIAHDGRRPLSGSRRDAPEAQLAAAARTLDAYAGGFTVKDADTVIHHLEVSSYQNDVGTDYVREMAMVDGELHLTTPPVPQNGSLQRATLVWRRATS